MSKENTPKENLFSTSVAIFIIPAYVYLCSYLYEKGLCAYYGIPEEFIKPDLTTNLYYSIALFLTVLLVYFYPQQMVFLFFGEKVKKNPALYPFLSGNTILIIVFISFMNIATYNINYLRTLILFLCLIPVINFLAFMQYSYIKKELITRTYEDIATTYNQALRIPMPILDRPDILNINIIFDGITTKQRHLILVLIATVAFSYLIGKRDGYKKEQFQVASAYKNFVVLRKYGDDIILKNFDPVTKKLGDSLIILKVGEQKLNFISKNVGQLKPSKEPFLFPSF